MSDLSDFKRLIYEPEVEALRARIKGLNEQLEALQDAIRTADDRLQQPIDLNYVALLKDDWERITYKALNPASGVGTSSAEGTNEANAAGTRISESAFDAEPVQPTRPGEPGADSVPASGRTYIKDGMVHHEVPRELVEDAELRRVSNQDRDPAMRSDDAD